VLSAAARASLRQALLGAAVGTTVMRGLYVPLLQGDSGDLRVSRGRCAGKGCCDQIQSTSSSRRVRRRAVTPVVPT
jgi:hypothetical protein